MGRMWKRRGCNGLVAASAAMMLITGCATSDQVVEHEEEEVELAIFMTRMQVFSQKLGYAVAAKNGPLAEFYLHEIEETTEEIQEKVIEYEGYPIASTSRTIIEPEFEPMSQAIAAGDWQNATVRYVRMIDACNRCHRSTDHGFIVVAPAEGEPPFNQIFSPQ